jgi:hypothetical protein
MSATIHAPAAPAPQPRAAGAARVFLLVAGGVAALVALALLAAGGAAIWGMTKRDGSGYFNTGSARLSTPSYAFASDTLDMGPDAPRWFGDNFATVRIQATSTRPIFVGIGRASDVERYLGRARHREITDLGTDPFRFTSHSAGGSGRPLAPASQRFWHVHASGPGTQAIKWPLEKGRWSAVVMNSDGSKGVSAAVRLGVRVSALQWVVIGGLVAGVLMLLLGGGLIYLATGTRTSPAAPA